MASYTKKLEALAEAGGDGHDEIASLKSSVPSSSPPRRVIGGSTNLCERGGTISRREKKKW